MVGLHWATRKLNCTGANMDISQKRAETLANALCGNSICPLEQCEIGHVERHNRFFLVTYRHRLMDSSWAIEVALDGASVKLRRNVERDFISVAQVKKIHGGIFSYGGFLYVCGHDGIVHEIASLDDPGRWIFYDQPKESKIDDDCQVTLL